MATYKVQQMAEIWYETEVEADSPDEAIDKAQESGDWEQLYDTTEFQDKFYYLDLDQDDSEGYDWIEYK